MTDIKGKALEMANAFLGTDHATLALLSHQELYFALVHVVERHEAFRQEVSDAVEAVLDRYYVLNIEDMLSHLIIPKPKPDPLVAVLHEVDTGPEWDSPEDYCNKIRAALDALGFEIREKNDDYYKRTTLVS